MSLISDISTGESLVRDLNEVEKEEEKKYLESLEEDDGSGRPRYRFQTRERKRIPVRLSEKELESLRQEMSEVVVHDFGDMYHLNDEERKEENRMYEIYMSIQNVKTKYKKLDEFVRASRKIMIAIKEIAEHNMVYDPKEFVDKVLKGEIIITGINFPRYSAPKKKRREVNWALVSQMIENPEMDESVLMQTGKGDIDQYDTVYDPEESMETMFGYSYEDLLNINHGGNELIEDFDDVPQDVNAAIPRRIREVAEDFAMGEGRKASNRIRDMFLDLRKEAMFRNYDRDMSRNVANSNAEDIAIIRAEDEERNYFRNKKEIVPTFHGNVLKSGDVDKFEYEVDEYLDEHTTVTNYRGTTMTVKEMEQEKLKEYLEECGLDVRKFYQLGKREEEAKKRVKAENKRLKKIKDRMLNNDSKRKKKVEQVGFSVRRVDDESDEDRVNHKKKKKNKKGHKQGKRLGRMLDEAYGKMDDYEEYRRAMMDDYDD